MVKSSDAAASRAAENRFSYRAERKRSDGQAVPSGTVAKLFANGRSQAGRLPKEFRMPGTAVRISRDGNRVILEPIEDIPRNAKGWPVDLVNQLAAVSDRDFPDPETLSAHFPEPEETGADDLGEDRR